MPTVLLWAVMLAGIVVLTPLAPRVRVPLPVLLTVFGLALPLLPSAPRLSIDPALILPAVLPPLLFAATQRSTAHEFRESARPILLLAVGLTVATAAVVAVVAHQAGLSWGPAWVLGAVVSPPDPVAATAVARRLSLPGRLVTVLEGEGMFNDATALVLYQLGVLAVVTGHVTAVDVGWGLLLAVAVGAGVGFAAGCAHPLGAGRAARRGGGDHRDGRRAVRGLPRGGPAARLGRPGRARPRTVPAQLRPSGAHLGRLAARPGRVALPRLPDHLHRLRPHRLRAHGGARGQSGRCGQPASRGLGGGLAGRRQVRLDVPGRRAGPGATTLPAGRHPVGGPRDDDRGLGGNARCRDRGHRAGPPASHRPAAAVPGSGPRSSSSRSSACLSPWWSKGSPSRRW